MAVSGIALVCPEGDPHDLSGPFGERALDGPFFDRTVCGFGPIWTITNLIMSIPGPLWCQK